MSIQGKLISLTLDGQTKTSRLVIETDYDLREMFDNLKDYKVSVDIKRYKERRSLSANAYFHTLVNKIAGVRGASESSVKKELVIDYGVLAKDEEGSTVGFKLPSSVNPDNVYPYTRCFNSREENGTMFNFYLVYKRTRYMDTSEMARLIDGAIEVAHEHGIITDTPEQIERLKAEWRKYGTQ